MKGRFVHILYGGGGELGGGTKEKVNGEGVGVQIVAFAIMEGGRRR